MQPISTKYTEIDGTRYTWIVDYVADIHSLLPPNELLLASDESEWEKKRRIECAYRRMNLAQQLQYVASSGAARARMP
jgi:hypothetical protein